MSAIGLGRWDLVREIGDCAVVVGDSATWPGQLQGAVAVCGSHGGATAVAHAIHLGAKGLILNDAGIGKDDAGISGLRYAESWGMAAATVGHLSARIGSGADTYRSGIVSHANEHAQTAGVAAGMTAAEAAERLAVTEAQAPSGLHDPPPRPKAIVMVEGRPPVIAVDSHADADASVEGVILVTGSHGGVVAARAVTYPVAAAFFNDAGIGKEQAGIGRLPILDAAGIPAATVSHLSARIGDARDTFASGRISCANEAARAVGIETGAALHEAVLLLQEAPR